MQIIWSYIFHPCDLVRHVLVPYCQSPRRFNISLQSGSDTPSSLSSHVLLVLMRTSAILYTGFCCRRDNNYIHTLM